MAIAGAKVDVSRSVKRCTCVHPFQDKQFGPHMRLYKRVVRNKGTMMERVEDRQLKLLFCQPFPVPEKV